MKNIFKSILITACYLFSVVAFAQDKTAEMSIAFAKEDGKDICKVSLVSEGKPVKDVAVKLFVKRLFGDLPIGAEVSTDETGIASFEFPNDLPLNPEGKLIVLAKVEDDENFGSIEAKTLTNIGIVKDLSLLDKKERSISGSNAPIYFIAGSLIVFAGIWGAILYVVLLVFKIKKLAVKVNP